MTPSRPQKRPGTSSSTAVISLPSDDNQPRETSADELFGAILSGNLPGIDAIEQYRSGNLSPLHFAAAVELCDITTEHFREASINPNDVLRKYEKAANQSPFKGSRLGVDANRAIALTPFKPAVPSVDEHSRILASRRMIHDDDQ